MKALIQRYSQQQVGRFMTIALLPFLALGSFGLVLSGMLLAPLIVTIPLYAAGMYLYVGYARIGWFDLDYDNAQKIWNRTVFYNGLLAFFTFMFIIWMMVERVVRSDAWDDFAVIVATLFGQLLVASTAFFAKDCHREELKKYNSKITEIGLALNH